MSWLEKGLAMKKTPIDLKDMPQKKSLVSKISKKAKRADT
jgi:hypothetical protein